MIAWLQGTVLEKQAPVMVLQVNGVGYEIEAPLTAFAEIANVGEQATLFIHMVVREDAQILFGFVDRQQRELFRSLIKINGVGPKVALALLSTLSGAELMQAVAQEDVTQLCKVPGIGKKTAERMLVELKDRLQKEFSDLAFEQTIGSGKRSSEKQDAIAALVALGYKQNEASRVINALGADLSGEDMIRQALRTLSGRVL